MTQSIRLTAIALLALSTVATAQEFPGIETLMTPEERRAAGIDALSRQQLDALNNWLERYTGNSVPEDVEDAGVVVAEPPPAPTRAPAQNAAAPTPPPAPPDDGFGKPPEKVEIVSRIAGRFEGWTGRTTFTLENGQVWQQRRGNRWKISLDRPEVRITQNFLGAYEMEVVSEGRSIGVRRIR